MIRGRSQEHPNPDDWLNRIKASDRKYVKKKRRVPSQGGPHKLVRLSSIFPLMGAVDCCRLAVDAI